MKVTSRIEPTAADVLATLQTDEIFHTIDEWYSDVLAVADVTVDPTYGVWQSGSTARLVPPVG